MCPFAGIAGSADWMKTVFQIRSCISPYSVSFLKVIDIAGNGMLDMWHMMQFEESCQML